MSHLLPEVFYKSRCQTLVMSHFVSTYLANSMTCLIMTLYIVWHILCYAICRVPLFTLIQERTIKWLQIHQPVTDTEMGQFAKEPNSRTRKMILGISVIAKQAESWTARPIIPDSKVLDEKTPQINDFIPTRQRRRERRCISIPCSKSCRVTSKKVTSAASKALRDGRTSATTKRLAGCVLSQRKTCK